MRSSAPTYAVGLPDPRTGFGRRDGIPVVQIPQPIAVFLGLGDTINGLLRDRGVHRISPTIRSLQSSDFLRVSHSITQSPGWCRF
jgi:hypothetical protein